MEDTALLSKDLRKMNWKKMKAKMSRDKNSVNNRDPHEQKMTTTGHQPQPEEVMHQVQAELANAYAQEFFSTVREKCFKMCVSKPSSALSGYERKCLEQCTERYVDATRMISQVVLKQYSQGGGGGGV